MAGVYHRAVSTFHGLRFSGSMNLGAGKPEIDLKCQTSARLEIGL